MHHMSFSQCSQTDLMNPASSSDDNSAGIISWNNVGNVTSSDNSRVTATALILGQNTHYLRAENFGFSLPSGASLCGIEVHIEKGAIGLLANVTDNRVYIIKGGSITGNNLASGTSWGSGDAYVTYGGTAETWGTTWIPSDINSSGFGVAISVNLGGISVLPTARIDHVRITVYYDESALPIELGAFNAKCNEKGILVEWTTLAESNNNFFHIQRSNDGMNWNLVVKVDGAGNSTEPRAYSWMDEYSLEGLSYYRLCQEDYNGYISTYMPIAIRGNCFVKGDELFIFPVPANDKICLRYSSDLSCVADISIFDQNGMTVTNKNELLQKGDNTITLDISVFEAGSTYILQITINGHALTARFVK